MAYTKPYEQLVGVLDVYIKAYPVSGGLTYPTIAQTIPTTGGTAWTLLGPTDGEQSIQHTGGLTYFRDNDGTGATKSVRPEEDVVIGLTVVNLSLEIYSLILNGAAPTDSGSSPNTIRRMGLKKGLNPAAFAMILRGTVSSPYGPYPGQYVIPYGVFDGEPNPTFAKDGRTQLELEFHALEDTSQPLAMRLGWLEVRVDGATLA